MNKKISENGVFVYSENIDTALELLSAGRMLAAKLNTFPGTFLLGSGDESMANELLNHGCGRVVCLEAPGLENNRAEIQTEIQLEALSQAVRQTKPKILLLGASRNGMELSARLAQRFRAGCASMCKTLDIEDGALVVSRSVLGGFIARQKIHTVPAMATVSPGLFDPPPKIVSPSGDIVRLHVQLPEPVVELIGVENRPACHVQIEKAERIVSIGRGLKNQKDLHMVEELAREIGGVVGASRPMTDFLQWLPTDLKVGLSGHTVRPKLYIACGISGAIEHVVGMREADVVVAINNDKNAPIMKEADYCIVDDLYKVIPALVKVLKSRKTR